MAQNKQQNWLRWTKWEPLTVGCFFTRHAMPCVRLFAYRPIVGGANCGEANLIPVPLDFFPCRYINLCPLFKQPVLCLMSSNLLILQFVVSHTWIQYGTIFSASKRRGEKGSWTCFQDLKHCVCNYCTLAQDTGTCWWVWRSMSMHFCLSPEPAHSLAYCQLHSGWIITPLWTYSKWHCLHRAAKGSSVKQAKENPISDW